MKQGYPLREISGFDSRVLSTLRDELSVTTAEELLHTATAYPDVLARLLAMDLGGVHSLAGVAAAALTRDEAEAILNPPPVDYPFRTGHDAPVARPTF